METFIAPGACGAVTIAQLTRTSALASSVTANMGSAQSYRRGAGHDPVGAFLSSDHALIIAPPYACLLLGRGIWERRRPPVTRLEANDTMERL
jgi:hypothetical protein